MFSVHIILIHFDKHSLDLGRDTWLAPVGFKRSISGPRPKKVVHHWPYMYLWCHLWIHLSSYLYINTSVHPPYPESVVGSAAYLDTPFPGDRHRWPAGTAVGNNPPGYLDPFVGESSCLWSKWSISVAVDSDDDFRFRSGVKIPTLAAPGASEWHDNGLAFWWSAPVDVARRPLLGEGTLGQNATLDRLWRISPRVNWVDTPRDLGEQDGSSR